MIGTTLSHYRILEQIGAGGMGVVYRARDERLERDVAIKVLPAGALADEVQRRRFHREALALSRLNHPGVATVHEFDREGGADFIVMELVAGETLAERLKGGGLPLEQLTDFGLHIAEALGAAHERGVLHRDLKPANIVVTGKDRVKVLDFGLAKLVQASVDTRATTRLTAGELAADLRSGPAALPGAGRRGPEKTAAPAGITSLAVLPLRNLSGDPEQDFFADGMTEALIARLAQIGSLRVISQTSAMAYKNVKKPLPVIAHDLAVEAVVEGSVLRSGDRVRISARLVDAATDRPLWSIGYDQPLGDILDLYSEVSRSIADELRAHLTPNERARLSGARPVDPVAYEAYLRGRFFWSKRSPAGLSKGLACFQESIDADPLYAPAWSGLADCHNMLGAFRWKPAREAFPLAHAAAARALELDPDLAEGHTSLAFATQYFDWDWPRADASYRRAIALNPGYATARQWFADFLTGLGRLDEALLEIERAAVLDSLSPVVGASHGDTLYYARRFEESAARYRRILELDSGYRWAKLNLARTLQHLGRHDEAIRLFEAAHRDGGMSLEVSPILAYAWAAAGTHERARAMLPGIIGWWRAGHGSPYSVANVYTALGDRDEAFAWLERALEDRDRMMTSLRVHPRLDPLRDDPRFAGLLVRMRLD